MHTVFFRTLLVVFSICFSSYSYAEETEEQKERQRLIEKIKEAHKLACKDTSIPCKEHLSNSNLTKNSQQYRDSVLEKIRQTAESNFPEALIEDGRYGVVIISMELDRNGKLEDVRLMKKTDIKLIDEFAIELVKRAQPYPQFEGLINEDIDVVVLTESFHFNTENRIKDVEKSN
ncbi:MAG: TonB family protein [Pseudomonadota bacterium]